MSYQRLIFGNVLMLLLVLTPSLAVGQEKRIEVTIDTQQTRPEIHPFVYAQFIEHLGRCVYGGIWAEMLEDRKFYFPITEDYNPYRSLEDTRFPVVGASPWQIVGPAAGVTMDTEESFVGRHTPKIHSGSGIQQRDLALVEGKEYVGYVWLKGTGSVELALFTGEGDDEPTERQEVAQFEPADEYEKHEFRFTAPVDTEHAVLQLRVSGEGATHVGTLSLMPGDNVNGMRPDTLALLKELDAPMYRWPGGNFVSGYEWRDGIGPRDRRPPRKNPAWTGVEHNDMGVDEFIAFCREVDAEPLIAVNTGFGDAHSAAAEVEYCNGSQETYNGGLRAANGHPGPYNVKYWCVGNEMFGDWQLGYMQLRHYTLKHNQCAEVMRMVDPTIELIGVGDLGGRDPEHDPDREHGWSETMLRECRDHMEYISEHFYIWDTPWKQGEEDGTLVNHIDRMRQAIRGKAEGHRELQDRLGLTGDKRVPIAMDEWNYWFRDYRYGELGCQYDLGDALGVAAGLHEYFRHTDIIRMAHYAQTVNVIGCIKTTKTDAFFDATALPLMLYRKHFGTTPVDVQTEGEAHHVDVSAALDDQGQVITLAVMNPNAEPVTVAIDFAGAQPTGEAQQWLVAGDDPRTHNEAGNIRLEVAEQSLELTDTYTAPGYSFSIVRLPVE